MVLWWLCQRAPARIQGRLDVTSVFLEFLIHHTPPKIPFLAIPVREESSRLSKSLALCVSYARAITLIITLILPTLISK